MGKRPNIVYVFPDEYRQQAMGFMNEDPVITPNLDAMSKESLVLTRAVSNFPICSPYRAMLFSGKYPISNGVYGNCCSNVIQYGIELKADERCISDVLADNGYSTGYIGKYHLDLPKEEHIPYTEGWRGEPGKGTYWDTYTEPGPRRHGFQFWHTYGCCDNHLHPHYWVGNAKVDERLDVDCWSTEHETDVAIEFLENRDGQCRDNDKPFALFVAHNPPHMPFNQVPDRYKDMYADKDPCSLLNRGNVEVDPDKAWVQNVADYFAAVTGVDDQFGRILTCLKEQGLENDTILVFTSDHGEMMGCHGQPCGKSVWYNESMLVPFLIRWPGKLKPRQDDFAFGAPDIMPTLLGLVGLQSEIPDDVEGIDQSALFLDPSAKRQSSSFYFWTKPEHPAGDGRRGVRTERYTFVATMEDGDVSYLLHDDETDPYQLANVYGENPEVDSFLLSELHGWLERTGDPWHKNMKNMNMLP